MPKISVYVSKDFYEKVRSEAKWREKSMSSFVGRILREHFGDYWSEDFLEVFGSLEDDPMNVPEELPWSLDCPRESFD